MKLIKLLNPRRLFLIFTREFDRIFDRLLWFKFNEIVNQNLKIRSKTSGNIFLADGSQVQLDFTTRTNKVGASHKLGQFSNLAVKFNKVQ